VTRAALAGVSVFALAYVLAEPLRVPVLLYDPWTGAVTVSRAVTIQSMRYFGDLLLATLAGLAAASLVHRLPARMPIVAAATASLSLVALGVLYYLSRLLGAS
jgi:hypothetical protein